MIYDHYFKKFEKLIEPKIIDYDGKDILIGNKSKDQVNSSKDLKGIGNSTNKVLKSNTFYNNNVNNNNINFADFNNTGESYISNIPKENKNISNLNNPDKDIINSSRPASSLVRDLKQNKLLNTDPNNNSSYMNYLPNRNTPVENKGFIKIENVNKEFNDNLNFQHLKTTNSHIDYDMNNNNSNKENNNRNSDNRSVNTNNFSYTKTLNNDIYLKTEDYNDNRASSKSKSKTKNIPINNINDIEVLKQIIKTEKNKNMNLRYENQELKKQIGSLDDTVKTQNDMISKLEKLRESDKKYVSKMETIIKNSHEIKSVNAEYSTYYYDNENKNLTKETKEENNSQNITNQLNNNPSTNTVKIKNLKDNSINHINNVSIKPEMNSNCNTENISNLFSSNNFNKQKNSRYYYIEHPAEIFSFNKEKYSVNINDKYQIKEILELLTSKLDFYEAFVEDIYDVSTNEEKLNQSVHALWKKLGALFSVIETPNDFELYSLKNVLDDFNYINRNIMEILDRKHKEYIYLLNKKQEQYNMMEGEAIRLREELTKLKLDRGVDLKFQHKLECENTLYKAKISEIENAIKTPKKRKDVDFNNLYQIINSIKIGNNNYNTKEAKNTDDLIEKSIYGDPQNIVVNSVRFSKTNLNDDKQCDTERKIPGIKSNYNSSMTMNQNKSNNNNFQEASKETKKRLSLNSVNSRKRKEEVKKLGIIKQSFNKIENILDMNDPKNYDFYNKLHSQVNN